jgi:hypothetical protein
MAKGMDTRQQIETEATPFQLSLILPGFVAIGETSRMSKPRSEFQAVLEEARYRHIGLLAIDYTRFVRPESCKDIELFRRMTEGVPLAVWLPLSYGERELLSQAARRGGVGRPSKVDRLWPSIMAARALGTSWKEVACKHGVSQRAIQSYKAARARSL